MHSSNSLVKEAQGYSNTKAIYMCHRGFKNGGGGGVALGAASLEKTVEFWR